MSVSDLLRDSLGLGERRQHPRTDQPKLMLRFDGQKYQTVDWSLGGARIKANGGPALQVRQHIQGQLQLEGADERGEFMAEVVRVGENGDIGLRWLELSPHIFMTVAAE